MAARKDREEDVPDALVGTTVFALRRVLSAAQVDDICIRSMTAVASSSESMARALSVSLF